MKPFLLLALLAAPASARVVSYASKGDPGGIEKALRAAGFEIAAEGTVCADKLGATCKLYLPDSETKDPAPIIAAFSAVDPVAVRAELGATHDARLARLKELLPAVGAKDAAASAEALQILLELFLEGRP